MSPQTQIEFTNQILLDDHPPDDLFIGDAAHDLGSILLTEDTNDTESEDTKSLQNKESPMNKTKVSID